MPTKTKTTDPTAAFALPSFEEATESIKDLNEKWMESSKHAGLVTLDAYEKAVASIVDFENKIASDSDVEWVATMATTHAKAISDMTSSYTMALRDLLK
ncbi:MAG: hypothetical protein ABI083_16945 [Lapillicoccus sp.]